jgi:glycosyltransferase involved in cell wall biosynthesis
MIAAVIPTLNDAPGLTATLSALAPAAIDGFLRQVIIADAGSSDGTLDVADDAGADVVSTGFADAIAATRQPWLLILKPGSRPQFGWEQAARAHMRDYPEKAGWFELALPQPGYGARLREAIGGLERLVLGMPRAEQGLLVAYHKIGRLGVVEDYAAVVRGLGRLQMRPIGARALMMSKPLRAAASS